MDVRVRSASDCLGRFIDEHRELQGEVASPAALRAQLEALEKSGTPGAKEAFDALGVLAPDDRVSRSYSGFLASQRRDVLGNDGRPPSPKSLPTARVGGTRPEALRAKLAVATGVGPSPSEINTRMFDAPVIFELPAASPSAVLGPAGPLVVNGGQDQVDRLLVGIDGVHEYEGWRKARLVPIQIEAKDLFSPDGRLSEVLTAVVLSMRQQGCEVPSPMANESMWQYLHRKDVLEGGLWTRDNYPAVPLVIVRGFQAFANKAVKREDLAIFDVSGANNATALEFDEMTKDERKLYNENERLPMRFAFILEAAVTRRGAELMQGCINQKIRLTTFGNSEERSG
jgi:hypothetical protein